jgi:hopanoid biosynthesis associated protein HpnK
MVCRSSKSPRSVVFSADDFGLSLAVNEAIERAFREGVLRRTSLMVAAPAAEDAVARARRNPGLRVGLHLVLVDGDAMVRPSALLDASGRFGKDQVRRGFHYFFRRTMRRHLAAEITAQFEAFAATGLVLSHADAHKHMHLHPTVAAMLIKIGRRYGLSALRVPAEPRATLVACGIQPGAGAWLLYQWARVLRAQARRAGLTTEDHVFGLAWSGHMTRERVRRLVMNLPTGSSEIYFHPATRRDAALTALMPDYDHLGELDALLDAELPTLLAQRGIAIASR